MCPVIINVALYLNLRLDDVGGPTLLFVQGKLAVTGFLQASLSSVVHYLLSPTKWVKQWAPFSYFICTGALSIAHSIHTHYTVGPPNNHFTGGTDDH